MHTIYKYTFDVEDSFDLDLPYGAIFLYLALQGTQPSLWFQVFSVNDKETRRFRVFGTGNPIPAREVTDLKYLGTFQQGPFVWHVYELLNYEMFHT